MLELDLYNEVYDTPLNSLSSMAMAFRRVEQKLCWVPSPLSIIQVLWTNQHNQPAITCSKLKIETLEQGRAQS